MWIRQIMSQLFCHYVFTIFLHIHNNFRCASLSSTHDTSWPAYPPLFVLWGGRPSLPNHVLERQPRQQCHGGHGGDGDCHHQPVWSQSVLEPYKPGKPLHDCQRRRDQGGKLQQLVGHELGRLSGGHRPWVPAAAPCLPAKAPTIISLEGTRPSRWTLLTGLLLLS